MQADVTWTQNSNLPELAWCLKVQAGARQWQVTLGAGVLVGPDFFAEGPWAGELDATGLASSLLCCATGAAWHSDRLLLVTPNHTLTRLHTVRLGDALWVSNSLACVLAASGQQLHPDYGFHREDLSSIIDGLHKARLSVPLAGGGELRLHYHCNVEVDAALNLRRLEKVEPPATAFADFDSYRCFLVEGLRAILANAADSRRPIRCEPLGTISRGYDSATCAVLLREAGGRELMTFFDPDAEDPVADDGAPIGDVLGMHTHRFSRSAYRDLDQEDEFLAVGTGGEDAMFAAAEGLLKHCVLVTGFHGDKVWERVNPKVSDQIIRGDPSGADLEEIRLRLGFSIVAPPFFGCRSHARIAAISNAAEMRPWSLGNDYDRPICRRIVEEAGIGREEFGQRKRVASRAFKRREGLAWYFGPVSLAEFSKYLATAPQHAPLSLRFMHRLLRLREGLIAGVGRFSYRLASELEHRLPKLDRHAAPFDETRAMFPWALARQRRRYEAALAAKSA